VSRGFGTAQRYLLEYLNVWTEQRGYPRNVWVPVNGIADWWAAGIDAEEAVAAGSVSESDDAEPNDSEHPSTIDPGRPPQASRAKRESMRRAARGLSDGYRIRVAYIRGQLYVRPTSAWDREQWLRSGASGRIARERRQRKPRG
jgi:hypothetical protein